MVVPFCFQTKIGLGAGIKMLRLVVVVSVVESHIHVSGPMVLLSIYPTSSGYTFIEVGLILVANCEAFSLKLTFC